MRPWSKIININSNFPVPYLACFILLEWTACLIRQNLCGRKIFRLLDLFCKNVQIPPLMKQQLRCGPREPEWLHIHQQKLCGKASPVMLPEIQSPEEPKLSNSAEI